MKIFNICVLIMLALFSCSTVFAQLRDEKAIWQPQQFEANFDCESNLRTLDILTQYTDKDALIIIVSHLGKSESKANIGERRLHNVKTYFTKSGSSFDRSPEFIITSEGERDSGAGRDERISGKGYLDFYVQGELKLRLYLGLNRDLYLGSCVLLPEDKRCSTSYERLFFPCRKT